MCFVRTGHDGVSALPLDSEIQIGARGSMSIVNTRVDYLGSDASRATIRMTHDADGPTVSMTEAMRYDWETSERLLKERKLNLIVDLDQTIVHATVDPTVGEWMDEASQFEAKHRARAEKMEAEGTSESQGEEGEEEDVNPNWAALSDVKRFKLGGEGLPLGANGQDDGSWYYVKPRQVYIHIICHSLD